MNYTNQGLTTSALLWLLFRSRALRPDRSGSLTEQILTSLDHGPRFAMRLHMTQMSD